MFKMYSFKLSFFLGFDFTVLTLKDFFIYYSYSTTYKIILTFFNELSRFKQPNLIYVSKLFPLIYRKTFNFNKLRLLFANEWRKVLKQFFVLNFIKMRYKGKGYKIYYKKNKCIYLRFGFSHKNYHHRFTTHSRFFYKWVLLSRIIFIGYGWRNLRESILKLVKKRYANIFTSRGMTLQRATLVKKPGKISTYF